MKLKQLMASAMMVGMIITFSADAKAQTYFDSSEVVSNQTFSNRYVSLFGGWVDRNQGSFSLDTAGPDIGDNSFDLDLETDPGFGVGFAIGRTFSSNWRIESEFVYRNQSLDDLVVDAGDLVGDFLGADPADVDDVVDGISTSLNTYTLAANIVYDFKPCSNFNPYVGFGTGVQFVGFRATQSDFEVEAEVNYPTVIYQWMAGVSKPLSQNSEVFVEYRGQGAFGSTASASLGPDSVSVASSNYKGSVFAGFRRNF